MGEGIRHRVALRLLLELVVTDGARRLHGFLDVALVQGIVLVVGVLGPDAREAIGHQLDAHGELVRLGLARRALLAALDLAEDAELVLDVVADLVGDDVGVGEVTLHAELLLHLLEERRVEIDLLVERAVERPHRGLGRAAAAAGAAGVEHHGGRAVLAPGLVRQDLLPDVLGVAEDRGGEAAALVRGLGLALALRLRIDLLFLARAPAARHLLGAADQDRRVDARDPADDAQDHDRADAEPAGAAAGEAEPATTAALAAPVLDIVGRAEIFPAHDLVTPCWDARPAHGRVK